MVLDVNVRFISLKMLPKCLPGAYFVSNNTAAAAAASYR